MKPLVLLSLHRSVQQTTLSRPNFAKLPIQAKLGVDFTFKEKQEVEQQQEQRREKMMSIP